MQKLKKALKYLVLFIEATIGTPNWLASNAWPEGDGFGPKMSGCMVILSLLLRPTIMIAGISIVIYLMIAIGKAIQ